MYATFGIVCPGERTTVWVDHVWETRPCGHGRRDEGAVGLMLETDGQQVGVFLAPEDGLMLADRIRRAHLAGITARPTGEFVIQQAATC